MADPRRLITGHALRPWTSVYRTLRRFTKASLPAVLFAGLSVPQPEAAAAPRSPSETDVKAAFLLNFTKFIDWPASEGASSSTPFTICILGDDPFGPILDQMMQGESVNGRPLTVQRLGHTMAKGCQILYVSRSEAGAKDLLTGAGTGVLTVGEDEGFVREGGMIAFVLDNRRVRFDINLSATKNAQLTLSSRLLAVARSVGK
jgi:hypothetical protein